MMQRGVLSAAPPASNRAPGVAYAARTPARAVPHTRRCRAPPPAALPRSESSVHHFYSRLRTHRQRLEHLVSTGATSAMDLAPVVTELRQMTAEIPDTAAAAAAWERMREQLQALERALAAASAPGGDGAAAALALAASAAAGSSERTSSSSSEGSGSAAAAATERRRRRAGQERLTVQTAAGAVLDLAVPDPDCGGLQAPCVPRLAAPGKVLVCTGRKCCAQGADATLAAARAAAAGSGVEVVASKCMGKCGRGPCVRARVAGVEGSALTKGVSAAAAETLLRQQFGVTC
ncbi:MAG: hypothetical protein J3K34DRAFT_75621 [Monoraphidium minutum]|nr:MAG: hypothetical protein J3K34DRAFT_75621 [Monoraphidium minutum]